mgnify:CR=1 FL=1
MLLAALRDLQWRRRRFAITVAGTALVFAMSLLMSGLGNSFRVEIDRTLNRQGADGWVTSAGAPGAFAPGSYLSMEDVAAISALAGPDAAPVLYGTGVVTFADGSKLNVTVMGVTPGGLGAPVKVASGSVAMEPGTVVIPKSVDAQVGDSIELSGLRFTVAGHVDKASLVAGTPTVTLDLADAQRVLVGGQPLVSNVLVKGPVPVPDGYVVRSRQEVREEFIRPLKNPMQSIDFVKVLLWAVAALIVASVVYLTVLERTRDIAVFKATGAGTMAIGAGVCLQAVILAIVASLLGIVLALLLAPIFPMDVVVARSSLIALPLLAVLVGAAAGLVGVRRSAGVSPATAFGGP